MKKIIAFIQNNFISCVCLFLAATIFTGSITLAKYISTETSNVGSSASSFHCSGSVDDVSSLSFANLDFWGGTEKDTPMNAIHSLNFLVNNYEERTVGESVTKHVSVAKMGYTLIFSAPAIFLEKLAVQLVESPDTVMTPQIVFADLLATANGGTFRTANSTDYNGTAYTDFEFAVNVSEVNVNGEPEKAYTATAALPDGAGNMVLKVEPFMQNMVQTLKFRLWDVSKLTSESNKTVDHEGGDLIAPLYADVQADVLCYRISISMPQFTLAAGVEEQDRYSLRFVTTSAINDHDLGGFLTNQAGKSLQNIYSGKEAYFKTVTETVTDKDSSGNVTERNTYYVIGNPRAYTAGEKTSTKETTEYGVTYATQPVATGTSGTAILGELYFDAHGNIVDSEALAVYRATVGTTNYTTSTAKVYYASEVKTTETEKVTTAVDTTVNDTETITQNFVVNTKKDVVGAIVGNQTITTYTGFTLTDVKKKVNTTWEDTDDTMPTTLRKTQSTSTSGADVTFTENLPQTTYSREIVRVTSYAESITFKKVYRRVEDALGNVTQTEYDSEDNAFELFDGVIQKYFLSQCYSKSYPFKVNVYFEQLQS